MQVKKQELELDIEKQTGSKLGKEYIKAVMLSPSLFNLYAEYFMRNVGLDEAQVGIKINGRNINNLRYADEIMASGPITSWQINGEKMETVTDSILGGSKITAAMKLKDACSLEEKL